jgi:hypothetical protein
LAWHRRFSTNANHRSLATINSHNTIYLAAACRQVHLDFQMAAERAQPNGSREEESVRRAPIESSEKDANNENT